MAQMGDLAGRLRAAALGRPPPEDGHVEVLASPHGPSDAVVAFTAHSLVASSAVAAEDVLARLDPDDLGAALRAPFLTWLGDALGAAPGTLDVVLAAPRRQGPPPLLLRPIDVDDHPRVSRAHRYRSDVQAWTGGGGGVLVIGRGLAGRWEVAFEVERLRRGAGLGRALAAAACHVVPDDVVFAQVAPGNAASLRAVLAAGYRPIGAEALFLRRP